MRILFSLFIILFLLSATPAVAQFNSNQFTTPESGIDLQPKFPHPGEIVTATINDYRSSSFGSDLIWVLDGKIVPGTKNKRTITFTAGELGASQAIEVVLTKGEGQNEKLKAVIKPIYLDIIVEPQTRTPDFYIGRALPSMGSVVNATALISGDNTPVSDLVYTWRIGQNVIEGAAIRGQNQVSYTTPMSNKEILSVEIAKIDGTIIAKRFVLIPSVEPVIQFYELSPLFGISNKVISDSIPLIGNSTIIKAEPYYLDSRVYNNPAIIEWKLGGIVTSNQSKNPYEITLERTWAGGSTGLEFHVRDTKQVLQGAKGSTRINF
ncbi:hypothetical protein GW937_01765 [Candidatus Kaiserbacteria bacterium]|nr:hypothetical protein [Candidatus Kaiserbacteria bacterium]NCT02315.1 hypothetical protein [Candidatus Parcubacteria bacterium]